MEGQASREIIEYEYRFETTPRYKQADETWELYDVFLKRSGNGEPTFIVVFRRKIK